MQNTLKLALTGAVLGLFVAAGLPAFAGTPPVRRSPTADSAPPAAVHVAHVYSQAQHAEQAPRTEQAPRAMPRTQSAPPPSTTGGEYAVPRYPGTPQQRSTVDRRYPGTNRSGTAVERTNDHNTSHHEGDDDDGGAAILGGFYGSPLWADGWWGPGGGWGGWGPYAYSPYGYYNNAHEQGALHIKVKPKTALVFVDGYYVGTVSNFDGFFSKLRLAPGPHRIEIRKKGYQTITFNVKIEPGRTITYKASMQKLP